MNAHLRTARQLTDDALLARAKCLADRERNATAELIAHLVEVERRKLHLAAGYSAMFFYCRGALALSESETFNRIRAARAARRFPVILDLLAEGAVNLTTVKLLAKHLTAENHLEVLGSARGRSRREVEKIAAQLAPLPDVPTSVRKLPAVAAATSVSPGVPAVPPEPLFADTVSLASADSLACTGAPTSLPGPLPGPLTRPIAIAEAAPAVVSALSPDRYKLQLTIREKTLEKLDLAKDMVRHADPSGDVAEILDRALTLLLNDLARKKFAATDRPRPSQGAAAAPESRHVPAEVKRIVFVRDLGRCAFVGKDGRRCSERASLEFHHLRPFAEGGLPTPENIELRCRPHNLYEWHLRSTDVRVREEEWLGQQVAAGVVPWAAPIPGTPPTAPGTSGAAGRAVGSASTHDDRERDARHAVAERV